MHKKNTKTLFTSATCANREVEKGVGDGLVTQTFTPCFLLFPLLFVHVEH